MISRTVKETVETYFDEYPFYADDLSSDSDCTTVTIPREKVVVVSKIIRNYY